MARGDVIGDVITQGGSSNSDIRPADGTEWVIKLWSGSEDGWLYLRSYDGTNVSVITDGSKVSTGAQGSQITIPINYTNYLQVRNGTSGDRVYAYAGYITKD